MVARGQLSTVCQLLCGRGIVFDECGNLLACSAMQNRSLGIYGVDFTTGDEMDALLEECVERGFCMMRCAFPLTAAKLVLNFSIVAGVALSVVCQLAHRIMRFPPQFHLI